MTLTVNSQIRIRSSLSVSVSITRMVWQSEEKKAEKKDEARQSDSFWSRNVYGTDCKSLESDSGGEADVSGRHIQVEYRHLTCNTLQQRGWDKTSHPHTSKLLAYSDLRSTTNQYNFVGYSWLKHARHRSSRLPASSIPLWERKASESAPISSHTFSTLLLLLMSSSGVCTSTP